MPAAGGSGRTRAAARCGGRRGAITDGFVFRSGACNTQAQRDAAQEPRLDTQNIEHRPMRRTVLAAARNLLCLRVLLAPFIIVAVLSCKDQSPPSIDGTWKGITNTSQQSLTLTLNERDGDVTGSGTISSNGGPRALTVAGSFAHPALRVTCTSGAAEPFQVAVSLVQDDADMMTGSLNGSGFVNERITLRRQR